MTSRRTIVILLTVLVITVFTMTPRRRVEGFDGPVDDLLATLRTTLREGEESVLDNVLDNPLVNLVTHNPVLSAGPSEDNSPTGWKALSDHALSERDIGGRAASSLHPFPPLPSIQAYSQAPPGSGTSLTDAAHTSVGSIMPRFKFTEERQDPRSRQAG